MKNLIFILFSLVLFVTGCGSSHPFERGKAFVPHGGNPPDGKPGDGGDGEPKPDPTKPDQKFFEENILPTLNRDCQMCHDQPAPTYDSALEMVVFKDPDHSKLFQKATGHGHRKVWAPDSAEAAVMVNWINGDHGK